MSALKKKHPGGRPTKYNQDVLMKTEEYIEQWETLGHKIPTIAGLAKVIDVSRERIAIWGQDKNKSEFNRMLSKLKAIQEEKLVNNGLDGTFNSAITKLVLSKHGYTDNPHNNQGDKGITVNVNRTGVVLKSGGQTLQIDTPETSSEAVHATIERDPVP